MAALMTGVVILVSVVITIYFWYKRYKRNRYNRKRKKENMDMSQPKYTEPDVQFVQSVFKPDNIRRYQFRTTESCEDVAQSEDEADSMDSSQLRMTESCEDVAKLVNEVDSKDNSQLRMTESCKDVVQSVDEADSMENSQLRMTDSCEDVVKLVNEVDSKDNSQLRMTESCKDVVQSGDETDIIDGSQLRMAESCNAVDQSENKSDPIDNYQLRMPESCKDVVQSVDEVDNIDKSQLRMTKYCKDVAQSVDEAEYMEKSQLRMTESCKNVTQSVDEAGIKDKSQLRMTEFCENVVQSSDMADSIDRSQITITEFVKETFTSVDEAYNDQSQNSQTDVKPSSKTESEGRSSHIPSIEAQPILSEEDNLLQAAFIILYTVPRAIEDFVDRKYKGGFVESIRDHKDQLKATLSSEEWELLSQIIAHHRLYHLYDKIIQDTILDKDVLDLLISKCILRIEDRAQIEHHPKPSDRNKCILDLLIQRPEDSYSVLLQVLKESPTCSKDLIECMEGQQFSHHEVHSQSKVKSCSTGNHSVRLQKNYYNLIQNLSDVRNVIDSLISKGVLEPDDHADIASSGVSAEMNRKLIAKIRSKQDYMLFLEALKEDPVSANAELASVLESTDVNQDKLNQTANIPQLTNRPGFQSLVTLVSMVKAVQISDTEPESHDSRLAADLYRLQSWYNKIIKMSSMDLDKYQQFVQTVNEIFGRISGKSDPVVKETTLSTVIQKQVKKMLHSLKEKEENSELKEKLKKMETDLGEIIPKNIRELIKKQVEDWEKKDKMFVSTRASDYVMEQLQDNSCLTLTAPSGVGKSFIARHTALVLKKQGYNIIPVESPADIKTYYHPGKQTVFIVDDICGNFTASQQQIENWKQLLPVINTIIADKCCKIIVSCRLQVYKDDKFNILLPFKSCECNLISAKLCLTSVEKTNIAHAYIGTSTTDIDDLSSKCDFFPLLCSLYHEKEDVDVKEYFKNPFDVYKSELERLSEHGDEGNYKICSLALCVLFNNQLSEKWFQGKVTNEQRNIIEDTCEACKLNRGTSKAKLKEAIDTLDGTFICKHNGIYRTVHDKLFDFLAHYFGQKIIECLIDHGDIDLVHERFIWQKSSDDQNSNIEFIIEIPDDYLESYLERFITDWSAGKVSVVFSNNNMKVYSFRQLLIQYLLQLDKSQQVILANTKDTVLPKENCGSGNTPLVLTCYDGYTDMVQWILHNDVDVDQCRDDGVTALIFASQEGHTDIVSLLLGKDPNVDLCDNTGRSPLNTASQNGHTEIVKLLLENDVNVDLCNIDGWSPLTTASQNGHTDIVKLLLEKNPNVDLCNKDGRSPLYIASQNGHTDIVKLLLEKNPNVNLCDKDGNSPLLWASTNGHTEIVKLLLEKNPNVDLCDKEGFTPLISSCSRNHISIIQLLMKHKPNINAQTDDGGNALYISALNGYIDITRLLLENNADTNICMHSKQSIADTYNNHCISTLNKERQEWFDFLLEKASSNVRDYISDKTVGYGFDVVVSSSPLHIACFMGRTDVVNCLFKYHVNINMTKEDGTTPLFYACEVGHEDIVRLLLDKGADTKIYRLDGKSPLNIATDNGHTSIVMMLKIAQRKKKVKLSS